MHIDIESLERATLDAVAPEAVGEIPGWLLPFDTGTVGRAISAVPLRHHGLNTTLLADIEDRYAARGLLTQFRVADVKGTAELQQALRHQGYAPRQATLTMVGTVAQWPGPSHRAVQCRALPTRAWESVYLAEDFDPVDGANRVRALSRSRYVVYAWIADETGSIAAGTASFSQGWASLHGFRTVSRQRGKGCAQDVVAALAPEARARGIERCFLQVDADNKVAIRLYRKWGFETAWLYHYWRRVGTEQPA